MFQLHYVARTTVCNARSYLTSWSLCFLIECVGGPLHRYLLGPDTRAHAQIILQFGALQVSFPNATGQHFSETEFEPS
jgi:hypothetical protein